MKKRVIKRGRHHVLPIVGDVVSELVLCVYRLPKMVFADHEAQESQLEFDDSITLLRGGDELFLHRTKPPSELYPLVTLLGATVVDALALENGGLEITFSNKWTLKVTPDSGYEAWHYQYPRNGGYYGTDKVDAKNFVIVHGADGRLI